MPARDATPVSPSPVSPADLDSILAIQITIAWAGETVAGEERLGWWRTELTDPDAGGDFLARLLPRTHAWAALIAAREAARRVDEAARRRAGKPDALWSPFHFGFALDERLDARLGEHRGAGTPPSDVFGATPAMAGRFERAAFTAWLEGLSPATATEVVPGGRKLPGSPKGSVDAARKLARALLPLAAAYPLPCYSVGGL